MASQPQLKLIKTLWGIEEPISASLFQSIQDEGYAGVEVIRLAWHTQEAKTQLVEAVRESGLCLVVCQIHTAGGYIDNQRGEYVYCGEYSVEAHQQDLAKQLKECQSLFEMFPPTAAANSFVNIHAGMDAWSNQEAMAFLNFALQEISNYPLLSTAATFETHRQRLFGNPWQTRELLRLLQQQNPPTTPPIQINADLSHWFCACERVFDATSPRDAPWWPSLLETLSSTHCRFVHARFGWSQGPQMADPSLEACQGERELQEHIWKVLLRGMIITRQLPSVCLEPEFGPPPYLPVHPETQEPLTDLAKTVAYTKERLKILFQEVVAEMEERGD